MIKKKIKGIVDYLITSNLIWSIMEPFARIGNYAYKKRTEKIQEQEKVKLPKDISSLLQAKKVLNGPFKGMLYPGLDSVLSTIYPKILGSYEKELQEIIFSFTQKPYREILDIGCAEGYYAVGMALKVPSAKIYTYDIDEKARTLCARMASLNKVEDRVVIKQYCSPEELATFEFTGRNLIICDCEGYEKKLFTPGSIKNLYQSDIIIETHDFLDITISPYLLNLFSPSHNLLVIKSIDDIEKVRCYRYPETEGLDLATKFTILREGRPAIMEWLICEPKIHTNSIYPA